MTESAEADGTPEVVILPADARDRLAAADAAEGTLDLGAVVRSESPTTNAIGYLQGSDPAAGTLLITAHLDHIGVRPDGGALYGANDDAMLV